MSRKSLPSPSISVSTLSINDIEFPPKFPQPSRKCQPSLRKFNKKRTKSEDKSQIAQTSDYKICSKKPFGNTKEKRIFQRTFCDQDQFSLPKSSEERLDSIHELIKKPIKRNTSCTTISNDSKIKGKFSNESVKISELFEKDKEFVGVCRAKDKIEKVSHIKRKSYNFTLTEDPRALVCLKNPNFKEIILTPNEYTKKIKETVKLADYVDSESTYDEKSSSICEEINLENPFGLDFQGVDYKTSFNKDEQHCQNVREYRKIKRYSERRAMKKDVWTKAGEDEIKKTFQLPEYFDISNEYDSNGELLPQQNDSNEKIMNKLENNISGDNKLTKIYRSDEKPINRTIIDMEEEQRRGRYLNLFYSQRERARNIEFLEQEEHYDIVNATLDQSEYLENLESSDNFEKSENLDSSENFDNLEMLENETLKQTKNVFNQTKLNAKKLETKENLDIFVNPEILENVQILGNVETVENVVNVSSSKGLEKYAKVENLDDIEYGENFDISDNSEKSEYSEKLEIKKFEKTKYPKNFNENLRFRHKMKKSKEILKEKGKMREEFFYNIGRPEYCKEAYIELSEKSVSLPTISDQTSDDEDGLKIGPSENKYLVRGYHNIFSKEIRGKLIKSSKDVKSGCITRNEWLNLMMKETSCRSNLKSFTQNQDPNDQNLDLFPLKPLIPKPILFSPINENIAQYFGQQYKQIYAKKMRLKKPKTIKVRKFNLTGYIYGTIDKNLKNDSIDTYPYVFSSISNYLKSKIKLAKSIKRLKRHNRMHFLGIKINKKLDKINKKTSSISNSDDSSIWIPEYKDDNDEYYNRRINYSKLSKINFPHSSISPFLQKPSNTLFGLKIAPKFRERFHGEQIAFSNIPNDELDKNLPYLHTVFDDKINKSNLNTSNKEYMNVLEARHHHDHRDVTQHKIIKAKYHIQVKKATMEAKKPIKERLQIKHDFDKAIPKNFELRDKDLTIDHIDYDKLKSVKNEKVKKSIRTSETAIKTVARKSSNIYHLIDNPPTDFPLRDKFLKLIQDMLIELKRQLREAGQFDEPEDIFDKAAYLQQLNDELESIKDCLSSLDSSICTNFTNDSGSFLLMQDKKLPMDYVRKSSVPFKEMNHVNVVAKQISDVRVTEVYRKCPFPGQLQEQRLRPDDKFHTFRTRIRDDTRGRLHVPVENIREKLLGATNQKKYNPQVATDIDDIYISTLNDNRPPVKKFKPRTVVPLINSALRKKFVCWFIQQKLSADIKNHEIEVNYYLRIIEMNKMLIQLFINWEKDFYEAYLATLRQVKPFYENSSRMKKEMQMLEIDLMIINTEIVYTEYDWVRLTILQNFHYLIKEKKWRSQNDWIHKKSDGTLESYFESIRKRYTVNIRPKDRDDAWAVKEYYENVYLPNQHPIEIVFHNAQEFNEGVNELRRKNFVCLVELHSTIGILTKLIDVRHQFEKYSNEYLTDKKSYVKVQYDKNKFMTNRRDQLMKMSNKIVETRIIKSFSDPQLNKFKSICNVIFTQLVPANVQLLIKDDVDIIVKTAIVFDHIIELLTEIDYLPKNRFVAIEISYRRLLEHKKRISKRAYLIKKRFIISMENNKRVLRPPFIKPKRQGKLPISILRKPKITVKDPFERRVSSKLKWFCEAFDEDIYSPFHRESMVMFNAIEEESDQPFHFDHFLRLNDYEPNYNFKTQIELRDGPEENRFKNVALVPDVLQKLAQWENRKKDRTLIEIHNNPEIYRKLMEVEEL